MKLTLYRWHKRLGLTLGLILFILGLSGCVVSYRDELLPRVYPDLFHVSPGVKRADLLLVLKNAEDYLGGRPLTHLYTSERDDTATMIFSRAEGKTLPDLVTIDPYSGQVKGEMPLIKNIFGVLLYVHANLLLGKTGSVIVGIMGGVLALFFLTGIMIFWGKNLSRKIRRLPQAGLRGLHRALGLFLGLPLLFSGVTGMILAFDLLGDSQKPTDLVKPGICTIEQQMAVIARLSPQETSRLVSIHFCSKKSALMKISLGLSERSGHHGFEKRLVDPSTTEVLQSFHSQKDPASWSRNALTIYPLHTGEFFGGFGRVLIFITGISLMGLYLTGLMISLRQNLKEFL